jgi:hypothetical protein
MKKLMSKVLSGAIIVLGLAGVTVGVSGIVHEVKADNEVAIKNEKGFLVLDQKEEENHTTMVCEAVPNSDYGMEVTEYGEITCKNAFDSTDFIVLTPQQAKGVEVHDVLLVTFDGDQVESVKQNDLNVNGKVFGQKIAE